MKRVRTAAYASEHGNIVVRDDGGTPHATLQVYMPGKVLVTGGTVSFGIALGSINLLVKALRESADELVDLQTVAERQLKEWEAENLSGEEVNDLDR